LLHVLDCATLDPGRDPISDLDAVEAELARYVGTLADLRDRPRLVALNKIDLPEAAELAALVRPELERRGLPVFEVSAVSRAGLRELAFALAAEVEADRSARPVPEARPVLSPQPVDDAGFTVEPESEGFVVRGAKPERWVRQTDFENDEAVGYLADRLARLGVEDELARLGAPPGATVTISGVTFDFEPASVLAEEYRPTRRGADERLDRPTRVRAGDRLAAKRARRQRPDDNADSDQ
jgi:GTP-binding protein